MSGGDASTCWFCEARPAHRRAAERVNLIRDRHTAYGFFVTVRSARTTGFHIPRCGPCARSAYAITAARYLRLAALVFAVILLAGLVITLVTDPGASATGLIVGVVVLGALAGLGEVALRLLRPRDTRRRSSDDHPMLLDAFDEGWDEGRFRP